MGTINYTCEFGVIHNTARCRCMSTHVTVRQVKCDVPADHHVTVEEYEPTHRKDDEPH